MDVPFTGGCACGAIRYRCSGTPRYMGNCHCRDCQQATGSAYFPCVLVKESDFTLESGEPSWFERPADKGHPMHRGFCAECGSPLFLVNGANPAGRALYAGSLPEPGDLRRERPALEPAAPGPPARRGHAGAVTGAAALPVIDLAGFDRNYSCRQRSA